MDILGWKKVKNIPFEKERMEGMETMVDEGIVARIKGKRVYVDIERNAKCEGCKICVFGKKSTIRLPAVSRVSCKEGDRVRVQMPQKDIIFAPVYLYAVPLLFMLLGLLIGLIYKNETLQIVLSFSLLIASGVVVFLIDKFYYQVQEKYNPVILCLSENNPNNEDT